MYVPLRAAAQPDGTIIRALITFESTEYQALVPTFGTPREPSTWTAVLRPAGDIESGRVHGLYASNEMADEIYVLDANLEPWTLKQLSYIAFGIVAAFLVLLGIRKHFQFSRARRDAGMKS